MMRIFCPSKGNLSRLTTHLVLAEILPEITFLVHTDSQAKNLESVGIAPTKILVHGIKEDLLGMVNIRDFVVNNLVQLGEWYCSIDDNVEAIYRVESPDYEGGETIDDPDRDEYKFPVGGHFFRYALNELKSKCEDLVTNYGGFGWLENPFFRKKKWQLAGYVKGKCFVHCPDGRPFRGHERIQLMSDHAKSFETIARYGSAPVNHWIYVHHKRFQAGGIGSHEERMPARIPTCEYLYEKYPGLVYPRNDILDNPTLRIRTPKSLTKWRKEHGYVS